MSKRDEDENRRITVERASFGVDAATITATEGDVVLLVDEGISDAQVAKLTAVAEWMKLAMDG